MAIEIKLPEMGEGIDSGSVVRVLVKEGDSIAEGQPLMELETDKALVEVPADSAGTVEKIHVRAGEKVAVGATLISLGGAGQSAASAPANSAAPRVDATEETDSKQAAAQPKQGAGRSDAEAEQAAVKSQDPSLPDPPRNGAQPAAGSAERKDAQPPAQARSKGSGDGAPSQADGGIIPAGPMTRRIARELGIELSRLSGSGQNGRITPEDVYAAARQRMSGGGAGETLELPDFAKWGTVERQPLSQVRRLTAEHMSRSWRTVPHVTQFERADVTDLEALRRKYEPEIEAAGGKMTLTVLLIKAVISGLKAQPQFNASIDEAAGELVLKQHYHIGIAVDTERGLLVPVLRDADRMDIPQLALELTQLADRARSGKIDVEELRGGTFTISNQGGIGGAEFTPIVNWPEAAILGVGRARKEPMVVGDTVKPRMMCPLALSYDHRIIDGAMAARFIRRLKESLEDPERLLLGL